MKSNAPVVLLLGSGPNAVQAQSWDRSPFDHIVAINNAYRLRTDWDFAIYPEDFPLRSRPTPQLGQVLIEAPDYVPAQNQLGGFVYAGGTMAFTAAYWALHALRPSVIAFLGCDMIYPTRGKTHFYGTGTADPLRKDVTLQSLEAKSARLALLAATRGCACVNLSQDPSRLVFPRADKATLAATQPLRADQASLQAALMQEATLGYLVPSGRYWEVEDQFDASALRGVDALWMAAYQAADLQPRPKNVDRPAGACVA
jgi:hypothetical protein